MAMSTGGSESGSPMSEINVTPLVDVMLVLLIIFMITAPLMSHRVTIKLPTANPHQEEKTPPPEVIDLAIKADGSMYFQDNQTAITDAELKQQFAVYAQKSPQPELQIRAAHDTEFKAVRKALGEAKDSGLVHVGFMTTGKE
ncbi:ExbD/TolR family protein [Dyella flagellata]|uniref:Biopolymer transport protein exbD1 n=1 Tax=Dyella flagellata TaxID=1867833 RepID=A0ABQ5X9Z0_9GAMM|nr:biopolymer transporter ExbD [Dyella flagellata]GLQ88447.1 biopolymer transport protein exbD1 [Dyella flagellata]